MREGEKWKWSRSVMSDPQHPPWTAASQAPPSMGFSRQEYWSGVPLPSLNYLNNLVQKHLLWLRIPGVVIKRIKTLIAVLIHERKSDFILGGNPFLLGSFPGGSVVKNPLNNAGDTGDSGLIPGPGSSLEEEMATHSSILAWKIPWTGEPGGLLSMGLQRVGYDWTCMHRQDFVLNNACAN